jgi:hypothetical protein
MAARQELESGKVRVLKLREAELPTFDLSRCIHKAPTIS